MSLFFNTKNTLISTEFLFDCLFYLSGSKLKCPFCERTYGYETNLRAHIRQRHQGIRVSCPYCPRTFTRNNTVRRHVAREHRNMPTSRIPAKFGSTRVMPDPIRAGQLLSAVSAATAIGIANNYSKMNGKKHVCLIYGSVACASLKFSLPISIQQNFNYLPEIFH